MCGGKYFIVGFTEEWDGQGCYAHGTLYASETEHSYPMIALRLYGTRLVTIATRGVLLVRIPDVRSYIWFPVDNSAVYTHA